MKQNLSILILMLAISIGLQAQDKKINKSFDGISEIEISTSSGDCQITKSIGNSVAVEVAYTYDDDVFEAILEKDGSTLILKEKFRKNSSSHGSSDWKLEIPENIKVKFSTGSGNLDAKNLFIEIKANIGSGDVNLDYVKGSVVVNIGSGETDAESFDGNLKVNAGSGDVDLSGSTGEFNINVGSGNIDANKVSGEFSMNTGSGDINATDLSLTAASGFNTGSGDAKVVLKTQLKNDISVNSGSGDATLDFNGVEIAGEITMKANKKHGEISAPFEFDSETEEERGNQTIVTKTAKIGSSNVKIKVTTGSGRAEIEN